MTSGERLIASDEPLDLALQACNIFRQPNDAGFELTPQEHGIGSVELVLEGGFLADRTIPASNQFLQAFHSIARRRLGLRRETSASTASMRASSRSVLASKPIASAKSRARSGLIIATLKPFA